MRDNWKTFQFSGDSKQLVRKTQNYNKLSILQLYIIYKNKGFAKLAKNMPAKQLLKFCTLCSFYAWNFADPTILDNNGNNGNNGLYL